MEDFLLSVAAKIAEYTVGPILHHAQYFCCFNNFVGSLPTTKEELELTRDNIKERVREATYKTEKIEPPVEKWLKDVEEVLEEVKMLEGRILEVKKSYFRGKCQYSLTKEIARITQKMTQLKDNSKFEPFSRISDLPGMQYYFSKDFVFFESTKSAYNNLLETLKNKSVRMIGLVGMGGSGKTSLAKEVGKKAEELKLFEKVVIATVSQTPNNRGIQAQIGDKLGVLFPEESEEGRAQRLSMRLKEGTTLLILDDVWEKMNFEALGIPFHENKACAVLLTTREREVCSSMQCQSIIELNLLTAEEAWSLFTLYANINDNTPNALKVVARKIVNECKGLAIAIVTVGSTLKDKSFEGWESALSRLEASKPLDVLKGLTSPHVCLKLSYDNLTNELAKSLLTCPMLTCLFMPSIAQTLVLLESLQISNCSELKNVIEEVKEGDIDYASSQSHTSLLLPKLRSLTIKYCVKMEYIFPLCFAEGLVSLETLIVSNNQKMKYVFGTEKEYQSQHETKIDINLLNLKRLELASLPNLVGIWPNYCRPRSPNLRWIYCWECSRLSDLFVHAAGNHSDLQQDITTMENQILSVVATTSNQLNHIPKFGDIWLEDVGLKGIFEFQIGDTNTQLHHPFHLDLSYLWMDNLPKLKFIWMGPTNFLRLQMLQEIIVGGCPKLRTIFSPTIVRSLPMLTTLRISDCETLEQIFDSSDAQQLNTLYTCSQQLCFPELKSLEVIRCNKLKCLSYNFVAAHFPKLTILTIEECSELEKVFAFEREADDGGQKGRGKNEEQLLLQKLTSITLKSLPNFEEIHPRFELKDHVKQIIEDCPKYSTNL